MTEKLYKEKVNSNEDMAKVLVSTIYSVDSIMLAATKFSVDRLFLIIDKKPDEKQKDAINLVKEALGNVMEVKEIKTEVYDIVKVAEEVTKALDILSDKDYIYVNITASRRTQALGLLYAAYSRVKKVRKIVYITREDNKIITLPKLSYNLNKSQVQVLEFIKEKKIVSMGDFADKVKLSKGMLYRTIKDLQDLGLIEEEDGFKLTDAGRIAVL